LAKLTHQQEKLAELLLQTLSFYEAYTLERLLIEIDKDFVEEHEKLTLEDLELVLKVLSKRQSIKISKNLHKEKIYQRAYYPKRSFWKKFRGWWEGL
jgi:hypothetical protein